MSDTDEEVVPDSQVSDASMITSSASASQPKRTFSYMQREDGDEPSQGGAVVNAMDEQLGCAICQEIMENPFLVLPCMHSYCRACLHQWWQNKVDCPTCKTKSQFAKHNFTLANVISQHRQDTNRISRRRLDDVAREDLYPPGRRPFISLPNSLQSQSQSQSQMDPLLFIPQVDSNIAMNSQSQSQGVLQPLPDILYPGGNLVFPCPSCDPANTTGYTCPEPIVRPSDELIDAEQQAYRPGGAPIREPVRGEPRVGLQAARFNAAPGASSHNNCDGCKTYIPAGWEPPKQTCGDCGIRLCSIYDPLGCTTGRRLRPRSNLSAGTVSIRMLWSTCSFNLRSNLDEQRRFEAYVAERNINVDTILEGIAEMKLTTEKQAARRQFPPGDAAEDEYEEEIRDAYAECDRKWGADSYFCDEYVRLLTDGFLHWWIEERRTNMAANSLPGTATRPSTFARLVTHLTGLSIADVAALPDCWYGYECRTQHNPMHPGHSARFNHICHNTAAERGRS